MAMLLFTARASVDIAMADDEDIATQNTASDVGDNPTSSDKPTIVVPELEQQRSSQVITSRLKEIKERKALEQSAHEAGSRAEATREIIHGENYIEELPSRLENLPVSQPIGVPVTPPQPRIIYQQPNPNAPGLAEDLQVPPENSPIFKPAMDLAEEDASDEDDANTTPELSSEEIELAKTYVPLDVQDTLKRAEALLDRDKAPITLKYLYEKIIFDHPDLEIALASVMEKEGNIIISKSQGNPKAGFDGYLGPYYTLYPDGTESSLDWGSFSTYVTQTLFDFGAMKNNIISDELTKEAATLKLYASVHTVVSIVTQYYLNAIQAQEVVLMRCNEVKFYKDLRDVFLRRQQAGTGLMTDVQKLDVSLKRSESSLINEMQRLITFRDMLSTLLMNQPVGWVITDSAIFSKNMNASINDLQEEALKRNLNLISINRDIEATLHKIKSMELDMMPKLGYKLAGGYQAEYPSDSFYTGAQATISWNIHDGGEHDGQVMKLRATLRKQKATFRSESIAMIDRVKASYNDYHVASKDLDLARNGKDLSIALTKNYLKEFDIGLRTLLDLVAAKEGEIEADLREINSRFRCVTGLMRLYTEVGLLDRYLPIPNGTVEAMARRFDVTLSDISSTTTRMPMPNILENKEPAVVPKWVNYE